MSNLLLEFAIFFVHFLFCFRCKNSKRKLTKIAKYLRKNIKYNISCGIRISNFRNAAPFRAVYTLHTLHATPSCDGRQAVSYLLTLFSSKWHIYIHFSLILYRLTRGILCELICIVILRHQRKTKLMKFYVKFLFRWNKWERYEHSVLQILYPRCNYLFIVERRKEKTSTN